MAVINLNWGVERKPHKKEWSAQEIAEFYRIAEVMAKAGLQVELEQGQTDEGDPWLVFMRPLSDDVVAHFARIDGDFVAVSSLAGQIYKGHDVRTVINQMLENHPLIVPRSAGTGKLLIHPSAVLLAFVAAAFVLSVDGSKAETIDSVFEKVFGDQQSEDSHEKSLARELFQSSGTNSNNLRLPSITEVTPAGFQSAVLGSVMVAHHLMELEIDNDKSSFYREDVEIFDSQLKVFENSSQALTEKRLENEADHALLSAFSVSLEENNKKLNESSHKPESIISDEPTSNTSLGFDDNLIIGKLVEGALSSPQELTPENSSSKISFSVVDNANLELMGMTADRVDGGQASELFINLSDDQLKEVVSQTYEIFDEFSALAFGEEPGSVDGIGIAVGSQGQIFTIGLSESRLLIGPKILAKATEMIIETGEINLVDGGSVRGTGQVLEDSQVQNLEVPIVGHLTQPSKITALMLTDAVDVVMYAGGDLQLSGFELGKDLLFFLQPELTSSAEIQMVGADSLFLSFEGVGEIRLFNLLDDYSTGEAIWG